MRPGNRTAGTGISRGAMSETVDPAIIGAGPAGMSAAIAAREHGADVLVLDEQVAPGGQIYRNVETVTAERPETARVLGEDYASGAALVRAFRGCGAEYSPHTSVWEVSTVARREDARAPLERAHAMTAVGSWGEIGVGGETGAASNLIDLAVTSEAAPRPALAYGSEHSIAR